ncbi:MAG: hypothetical protein IPJ71_02890 [Bdellovibrionales bacterium]|nr:hypothetical protein [Bdellovibrionales bacterium]
MGEIRKMAPLSGPLQPLTGLPLASLVRVTNQWHQNCILFLIVMLKRSLFVFCLPFVGTLLNPSTAYALSPRQSAQVLKTHGSNTCLILLDPKSGLSLRRTINAIKALDLPDGLRLQEAKLLIERSEIVNWGNFEAEDYKLLGRGWAGVVFKVTSKSDPTKVHAVKRYWRIPSSDQTKPLTELNAIADLIKMNALSLIAKETSAFEAAQYTVSHLDRAEMPFVEGTPLNVLMKDPLVDKGRLREIVRKYNEVVESIIDSLKKRFPPGQVESVSPAKRETVSVDGLTANAFAVTILGFDKIQPFLQEGLSDHLSLYYQFPAKATVALKPDNVVIRSKDDKIVFVDFY